MLRGPAEMPTIGPLSGEPGCGGVMRLMYSSVGVIVSSSSASFLHTVALRTPKPSAVVGLFLPAFQRPAGGAQRPAFQPKTARRLVGSHVAR